jgi:uncharacterized membrane protein YoaT (DUF817 family)
MMKKNFCCSAETHRIKIYLLRVTIVYEETRFLYTVFEGTRRMGISAIFITLTLFNFVYHDLTEPLV